MDFEEVLNKRASCRSYAATPVGKDVILEILRAGSRAPSPLNLQPWEFVVLLGERARTQVHEIACATRDAAIRATGKAWLSQYDMGFLLEAPVMVVVLADSTKIGLGDFLGERSAHVKAASACVENILLAATNRGLGSIWFTLYDAEALRRTFQIASNLDIVGVLPLGYPKEEQRPTRRKDIEEKIQYIE